EGSFDRSDGARSGRPSDFDKERLNALVHEDPDSRHANWLRRLAAVMFSSRSIPSSRGPTPPVLQPDHHSDEKWYLYVNMKQRKEWLSPGKDPTPRAKPKFHERKIMLSIRWDCEGVIHFELLPRNHTLTAAIYVEQLRRLASAVQQKRQKKQHASCCSTTTPDRTQQ
ncbi:hypothetical protein M514_03449, partial [Trichuris suis]